MARPPDADSAATYDRIIQATLELAQQKGLDGLSLRRVAQLADVGLGTVTYYFGNKHGLLEACLDGAYQWIWEQSAEALARVAGGADVETEIRQLTRCVFRKARTHRPILHVRMVTTLQNRGLPTRRLEGYLCQAIERVTAVFNARQATCLRLAVHSFELVVLRYAAHEDYELCAIAGIDELDAAVRAVEDHLAEVSVAIFRSGGLMGD